jgi:molybdopterin-guanine dinucleotide biosynthesis protein A
MLKRRAMFHPYELALCGLSDSGKTTLATRLLRRFTDRGLTAGYFKHGCHRFDIDRPGKDSFLAREAGAPAVMIADPEKEAFISAGTRGISPAVAFESCDLLLIEGLKELPIPKLLVVDAGRAVLPLVESGNVNEVLALVHDGSPAGLERFALPCFHRDDIASIARFIETVLGARAASLPMNGLVLAGGRSSRMGSDKALLRYGDNPQIQATAALLDARCNRVFVSCRNEQAPLYDGYGRPIVTDAYLELGPLGGLLSAQRQQPDAAWFVVACDFPLLDAPTLGELCSAREPFRFATAFRLPGDRKPEPLCTIYEPKSRAALLRQHGNGDDSLASFLDRSRIRAVEAADPGLLRNANDREGMNEALRSINGGGTP